MMKGEKRNELYVLVGFFILASVVMTVESNKISSLEFCENCVFGKAHRAKFPKGAYRSKCVLKFIQSDLWGIAQVPSLSRVDIL